MSVTSILSRTSSNIDGANVQQLSRDFKKAAQGTLDNSRFDSRAELQGAGLDREFDKLQGIISRANVYDTTTTLAKSQLTAKQVAIGDIRSIIAKFKAKTSQEFVIGQGRVQDANEALNQVVAVLNRKVDGKYIFGGKNDNQPPVQIDVTTLTSQNVNTFTNVAPGSKQVQVSDSMTVDTNLVTAADFKDTMAALVMFKTSGGQDNLPQIQVAFDKALSSFGVLETKVLTASNQVDEAVAENNISLVAAKKEIDDNFTVDIITQAENLGGAMRSLLTNFKVSAATNNVLNNLMNNTSI